VSGRELTVAQEGLAAWRRGDLARVEAMLAPDATWRWWEPGEWDCANRDEVLRTLRERYEQGFGRADMEVLDGGPGAVVVVSHPREVGGADWPAEAATVLSFAGGKVVAMQDYRTREDALAAVGRQ
jgi:ketosteroid isomerase-like protein